MEVAPAGVLASLLRSMIANPVLSLNWIDFEHFLFFRRVWQIYLEVVRLFRALSRVGEFEGVGERLTALQSQSLLRCGTSDHFSM